MKEPYYKGERGILYLGDCLEVFPSFADKSIDLVLSDFPYNVGIDYGETTDDNRKAEIYAEWVNKVLKEMRRVGKAVAITPGVGNLSIYPKPDWTACWYKHGSPSRCPVGFNGWEPVLIWGKRKEIERVDVFDATLDSVEIAGEHPCPKPVKLFREIILHYTRKDETVLDCFFGSGTTAMACEEIQRNWIGIEINKAFCDLAIERVAKWKGQRRLW